MARMGSKATTRTVFPGQFTVREGTFEAELLGMQIYWNDSFQKDQPPELQVGFILGIDDAEATHDPDEDTDLYIHREQFVRLQVDDDGAFSPGGARAKAYKLFSAFYGQDFDAFDEDFQWELEAKEFDQMDSIEDIPHRKDYDKNEEWLKLDSVTIMGEPIFGKKAMVQFGNAQKPDGSYSDRVTIVGAMAMPRSRRAKQEPRKAKASKAEEPAEEETPAPRASGAATPSGSGDAEAPAHVKWVTSRLEKAGLDTPQEVLAFLAFFAETPLNSILDLPIEVSKKIKGLWQADDGEQMTAMVDDWKDGQQAAAGDPDDDEFAEEEPAPKKSKASKSLTKGGKLDAMRQKAIEEEFPPDDELPF